MISVLEVLQHLVVHAVTLALWISGYRAAAGKGAVHVLQGACLVGLGGTATAFFAAGGDLFAALRDFAWIVFFYGPLFLILAGRRSAWRGPVAGFVTVVLPLITVAVGFWAFQVEPKRLETSFITVASPKITTALRIAVVADLQTDHIGDHERAAVRAVMAAEPDLILLTGDYLQMHPSRLPPVAADLRRLLIEEGLDAPLGVYAVRGDVDLDGWPDLFDGTAVETWTASRSKVVGGIEITGLAPEESRFGPFSFRTSEHFHVMFGHAPDFALRELRADLLLAGHTHGGQVQLPGFGPLLTYSEVPRDWASGLTRLKGGRTLVVSRGIGMERAQAPRLRFFCRPEVVVVDLEPADELSATSGRRRSTARPTPPSGS